MAFWKFGKQKKEVADMATTDEKEIRKAWEDIERKGTDSQTERDREDESVAAQERDKGEEDSQTAKDRIDESKGARRKDEEREREEKAEKDEDRRDDFRVRLDKLEEKLDKLLSFIEPFDKNTEERGGERAMEKARETYGVGNRPFGESDREDKKGVSKEDIVDIMRRIKG